MPCQKDKPNKDQEPPLPKAAAVAAVAAVGFNPFSPGLICCCGSKFSKTQSLVVHRLGCDQALRKRVVTLIHGTNRTVEDDVEMNATVVNEIGVVFGTICAHAA